MSVVVVVGTKNGQISRSRNLRGRKHCQIVKKDDFCPFVGPSKRFEACRSQFFFFFLPIQVYRHAQFYGLGKGRRVTPFVVEMGMQYARVCALESSSYDFVMASQM